MKTFLLIFSIGLGAFWFIVREIALYQKYVQKKDVQLLGCFSSVLGLFGFAFFIVWLLTIFGVTSLVQP